MHSGVHTLIGVSALRSALRDKGEIMMIELPGIGVIVPVDEIERICLERGLDDLWRKIWEDPPLKPFRCDGCSLWPDKWGNYDLYPACFIHDVKYWCGYKGERVERLQADLELALEILAITQNCQLALLMFRGVLAGGHEIFNREFSWGFGRY